MVLFSNEWLLKIILIHLVGLLIIYCLKNINYSNYEGNQIRDFKGSDFIISFSKDNLD